MNNPTSKKNKTITKSINPFQEDFLNLNESQDNPLAQTMFNINDVKLKNDVLGNIPTDIIFENKIKKQLSGKSLNGRRNSRFISGKNINEFRHSLKDVSCFFSNTEESLNLRKIPKISEKDYENLKGNIIDHETLSKLYNTLINVNCNFKSLECGESVGGLNPLTFLIEKSYSMDKTKIKEMSDKYNILKDYIYNYRTINMDGNCFYRAVMFRYLEILILNNKIEYLQNLINDIIICFNKEELKKKTNIRGLDIKPELTYKILILIVDLLKYNKKEDAHKVLVKSFSTSQKFDYAIILYFRYILYDYIRNNENKVYLKSFPIKIGNLLPRQYETEDGQFLFDKFYQNYLLNFFTDAEKIIIYLTPLVLGIELNVIIYDDNEEEILQKFKWEGNSELQIDDVISLLNNRNHYEIIYTSKDNEKNKKIFTNYENNQKSVILSEIVINQKKIDIKESDNFNLLADSMKLNIEDQNISMKPKSMVYKKSIINNNSNQNINKIDEKKRNNNNTINNGNNNISNIYNNNHNNSIHNNNNHNNNTYNNNIHSNNINNIPNNNIPDNNIHNNNIHNNNIQNFIPNNNIPNNNVSDNSIHNKNIHNKSIPNNNIPNNTIPYNNIPYNNIPNNTTPYNNMKNNNISNNINTQNKNNNMKNNNIIENNKVIINNNNKEINNNSSDFYNNNNIINNNRNNNKALLYNNYEDNNKSNNKNNNNNFNNYYTNQTNNNRYNEKANQHQNYKKNKNSNLQNPMNANQLNYRNYYTNDAKNNSNYNNLLMKNDLMKSKEKSYQNNIIQNNINNANKNNNSDIPYKNQQIGLKTPGQDSIQSNIKPSSNNSDISNKGFMTPYSNINSNKCINCSSNIENPNIDICKQCFKSKIIDVLYSFYIQDMKHVQDPMNFNGMVEIKIKRNISPQKYKIYDAINEYNIIYNEKLYKEQLINEIKKKICRFCQEDINEENYNLPCNCHFCSIKHLDKYLQSKKFDLSKGFKCYCSQVYNREMMLELGVLCNELKISAINNVIKYFNNKLYNICCICGKTSNIISHEFNLQSCLNKKKEENFIKLLAHYFCQQCYKMNINNSSGFPCQICKIKHYFYS